MAVSLHSHRQLRLYQAAFLLSPLTIRKPVQLNPKSIASRRNYFFDPGRTRPMLTCVLRRYVTSAVLLSKLFAHMLRRPRQRETCRNYSCIDISVEIRSAHSVALPFTAEFGGKVLETEA